MRSGLWVVWVAVAVGCDSGGDGAAGDVAMSPDGAARDVLVTPDGAELDGSTDGPTGDGPATDGPATDGPATDGPPTDGPATDGPASDGPASDGPATDGPVPDAAEADVGAGGCRRTRDCLERPAPIRCVGTWRCDPDDARPADHRGLDGCDYTCLFNLAPCVPRGGPVCAGDDLCRPCPRAGACGDEENVCLDPDAAWRCGDGDVAVCAGLPHDGCVGAWACIDSTCDWVCD